MTPLKGSANDTKICKVCGRTITWRKKWEKNWEEIQYCSDACRRSKSSLKGGHEETILSLLGQRDAGKTICPSEVLPLEERKDKSEMEKVREAARRLVAQGKIDIVQGGEVVNPSTAKGPIRLRLKGKDK
ncbi:MAG: DUF2256 and DUF3253 domain-containing protein [Proteobacteria bacterium]|nr:MAG: DUF2256 and DUF3253 domain-containing protein [Pseudomonadota bacterium]